MLLLQNEALGIWNSLMQKSGFPKVHHYVRFLQIRSQLDYEQSLLYIIINSFAYNRNPKIFHYIRDFTIAKSFPTILQCGTSKVESDREAKMFNNYFYVVFTSSSFVLSNVDELVKPTSLI